MDLRAHVGKALKHYRVLEGGCYDSGIYYLIWGNMSTGKSRVVEIKAGAEKKVLRVSAELNIGHANDCCVRGEVLYVTHSGEKGVIHRVSTKTLAKLSDVKLGMNCGFNGISCFGDGFILKRMYSRKCYIFDGNWKVKKIKKGKHKGKPQTITLSKTYKTGQGMTWHGGKLYRASSTGQSKNNKVAVYNAKGKLIKTYKYEKKCELEDVMIVNGKLVISYYLKHKVDGKKKFEAYLKTLKTL